jgi:hypothetical protein
MAALPAAPSLQDEVIDFLASGPTPEQILALHPSDAVQQRISALLDRNRSSTLTADEQTELDEYLRLDHFVTLLKARARQKLQQA